VISIQPISNELVDRLLSMERPSSVAAPTPSINALQPILAAYQPSPTESASYNTARPKLANINLSIFNDFSFKLSGALNCSECIGF